MVEATLKSDGVKILVSLEPHGHLECGGVQCLNLLFVGNSFNVRYFQRSYNLPVFFFFFSAVLFLPVEPIRLSAGDKAERHTDSRRQGLDKTSEIVICHHRNGFSPKILIPGDFAKESVVGRSRVRQVIIFCFFCAVFQLFLRYIERSISG